MPKKLKEKILWIIVNAIFTLALGFILLAFTSRGEKWLRTKKAIDKKADVEYVNKQDDRMKADFEFYRVAHEKAHGKEYRAIQDQLELIQRSSDQQIELLIKLIDE